MGEGRGGKKKEALVEGKRDRRIWGEEWNTAEKEKIGEKR